MSARLVSSGYDRRNQESRAAYEALSSLEELDGQRQVDVTGAAVVVRSKHGRLETKDQMGDTDLEGTAVGGTVGSIIAILGGPLGVLLGGATGLWIGSPFDLEDSDDTESALGDISRAVRPGHTALIVEATEQSPERMAETKEQIRVKIDKPMAKLKRLRVGIASV